MILKTNKILPTILPTNSLCLNAIGVRSGASKKEYIKGHVTDGATSVILRINNVNTRVPVGADGWFEWIRPKNYQIETLYGCIYDRTNIDIVYVNINAICPCDNFLGMTSTQNNSVLKKVKIHGLRPTNATVFFGNCGEIESVEGFEVDGSCSMISYCFVRCYKLKEIKYIGHCTPTNVEYFTRSNNELEKMFIPDIRLNAQNVGGLFIELPKLKDVNANIIERAITFKDSPLLTEQSVVNLFNAVAKDGITLTLHPTVGAMIDAQMDAGEGAIFDAYMNSDYDFDYTY